MGDQGWQSTADHSPELTAAGGWQSTADHSPAAPQTDDEIIRAYGYDPAVIKKAHLYSDGTLTGMMKNPTEMLVTPGDSPGLLSDAAHGFFSTVLGLNQLASHGLSKLTGNPADAQFADLVARVSQDAYKKIRSDPSTVAQIAGSAMIPVPGGAAETIPGALARGALSGAAASAMQPVNVAPGGDYWTEKAKQALVGGTLGGATGGVIRSVGGGVNRVLASRAAELPEETAARTGQELSQQVTKLDDRITQTPFGGYTEVQRAAAGGDRAAAKLVGQMNNAQTPDQILQTSIGLQNWRTGRVSDALYDKVDQAVAAHPELSDVPLTQTEQTIEEAINNEEKAKDPDKALLTFLKTVRNNIGAGESDQLVDNSYGQIRQFHKDLGERVATLRTGQQQLLGPSAAGTLQQIRNAVDTDMRNFIADSGVPDVQKAADAADQYYAQNRVPFKARDIAQAGTPSLSGAGTSAEADQIFDAFIKAGKGDKAQRFFDALDPRGRAAVQYQIAADAMNQATDPVRGTFDAQKFFEALDKTKEAYGVFFKGPDAAAMDGLKNLARESLLAGDRETALKSKLNTAIGLGTAGTVASGALGLHSVAATTGALTGLASVARAAMTSDAGRRLLASASTMAPGNPQLAKILDQLLNQAPAAAARAATQ